MPPATYRLVRTPPGRVAPPALDAAQRAVVDHRHGPLLVLAGPGTGKTTTLVESVARRVRAGTDPERILVLTFSRKAAVELRDRLAARLTEPGVSPTGLRARGAAGHGRASRRRRPSTPSATPWSAPTRTPTSSPTRCGCCPDPSRTSSSVSSSKDRRSWPAAGRARVGWPDELRACLTTRGFADEVRAVLARSRELGLGPDALGDFARRTGRPDWSAAAGFLAEYLDVLDGQGVLDYAELVHRAVLLAERTDVATQLAAAYDAVYVDEYQDTDVAQVRLLRALMRQPRSDGGAGLPGTHARRLR